MKTEATIDTPGGTNLSVGARRPARHGLAARLPVFDHLKEAFLFIELGPHRLTPFEGDFVQPFALAFGIAAEMGSG